MKEHTETINNEKRDITLSIIVPVYNCGKFLNECLNSLIEIKRNDIEILLIDDGSSDGSEQTCDEYATKEQRITVIHNENKGVSYSRNCGISIAKGKLIMFVDGDDAVDTETINEMDFDVINEYDVVMFGYKEVFESLSKSYLIDNSFEVPSKNIQLFRDACLTSHCKEPYDFDLINPIVLWNKIYNKNFIEENKISFTVGVVKQQDMLFNIQIYSVAKKMCYKNKILYYYRRNENSVSNRYQKDLYKKYELLNKELFNFIGDNQKLLNYYYEYITRNVFTCILLDYCNVNNKNSSNIKNKGFMELMKSSPYKEAIKNTNTEKFTFNEKVLYKCCKNKNYHMCNLLCKLRNIVQKITNKRMSWD